MCTRAECMLHHGEACVCLLRGMRLQGHGGVLSYVDRAKSKGGTELLFRNM
jgi:hypothetical protein